MKELIEGEGSQINKDLKERKMQDLLKMQLSSLDESHKLNVNELKETFTTIRLEHSLNENIEPSIKVQNSEKELLKYESPKHVQILY